MSWKKDKFRNLIENKSGYTWSKEQEISKPEESAIRVLTVTNVQKELDLTSELYLLDVSKKDKEEKAVSKNWSIAVNSNGNRKRIGNAVFIKEDTDYLFASFLIAFKPKDNSDIIPEFFYRWLSSEVIQERISAVSEGTTGLGNLDLRYLRRMEINYPEYKPEQTAIAAILSRVDAAIEATQNSIKAAEKLKKALMQNLLTGKLKPDGAWRSEDEFYMDEKFGKVPKGWEIKSVKEIFDFFPTASYARSSLIDTGEIMYIHYGDIHTKFDRILDIDNHTLPFIPLALKKKFELLKDGDLVVSDASEDWEGVGKCIELTNIKNRQIIAGLHTLHLRPKTGDLIKGIVGYIFNTHKIAISIRRLATGIKVYGISKPNLERVLLPIPTNPEQMLIKDKLDFCSNEIISKTNKINTLQRLKKSLMQHLLTGKKRLPQEVIELLSNQEEQSNSGVE